VSDSAELIRLEDQAHQVLDTAGVPSIIVAAGTAAQIAWDDFFSASLRNPHTRAAYAHAIKRFLMWVDQAKLPIERITPGMIGRYFADHPGSICTRKLHLAAIRAFFDLLVTRHIVMLNPAASVRGERYQAIEGKTPEISIEQARHLLASLEGRSLARRRDRAIVGILIYTAARAGAVGRLRVGDFVDAGTQWVLRFAEKGGKSREIPVRHDLQHFITDYLVASEIDRTNRNQPLFPTIIGRADRLSGKAMSNLDICRMVKRRLASAGLPTMYSPHSFRVTTCTDLLTQGIPLEDVQYLAGHADARTTRLYDRRQKKVTRNVVERISV
jgi:site-specific recombinase XerD